MTRRPHGAGRRAIGPAAIMPFVTTRDAIHTLVDDLDDTDLERAKHALEELVRVELSDAELKELLERSAACRRGEGVDAREFLAQLRGDSPDSDG
jgi:hypothetical protein